MKQAIIYSRFSPRPNAEECESCEKQEDRCREYCEQQDYEIVAYHKDKATTGGLLYRPGLDKAINSLRSGMVMVVDRNDRLARDMLVSLTIRHRIDLRDATLEYADGSPGDCTPEGELFQNILAAFAAYERGRIRARLRNWAVQKKERGEWMGRPPIGWMIDPEDSTQLVENDIERQAIVRICDLNLDGYPSGQIANILTNEFGPCRGNPWSDRTVRRLINKHYNLATLEKLT